MKNNCTLYGVQTECQNKPISYPFIEIHLNLNRINRRMNCLEKY